MKTKIQRAKEWNDENVARRKEIQHEYYLRKKQTEKAREKIRFKEYNTFCKELRDIPLIFEKVQIFI